MNLVPDLSGHVIGNWRLMRRLGVGSFGAVYEAHNTSIDKQAALKVLLPQWAVNPAIVSRFLREASAASRARHPSVVEFYDGGTAPDGLCYMVMELCSGPSLSQILKGGALGPERTMRLGSQLADALEAVHAQRVVHRDLKPDNILLVPDKREVEIPKILDFGIAKLRAAPAQTIDGQLLGTPAYMSPEQCRSEPDVDHRADVYSLGVVLYECLTGSLPFQAEHYLGYLTAHTTLPPPDPRGLRGDVPEGLATLLVRMLAKHRDARPASMAEVRDALDALRAAAAPSPPARSEAGRGSSLAGAPVAFTPTGGTAGPVGTFSPPMPSGMRPLLLFGALGLLVLGGGVAMLRGRTPPEQQPAPTQPAAARDEAATRAQAAREQAEREKAAKEQAAKEQAEREKAARQQAETEQAERAQAEQAKQDQAASEQAGRDKATKDRSAHERAAKDRPARDHALTVRSPISR